MSAIDEMVAFLNRRLRESETKGRNIDMIAYYYGFGIHLGQLSRRLPHTVMSALVDEPDRLSLRILET